MSFHQWLTYAKKCVETGLKYFQEKFTHELSGSVAAFKAARWFLPHKVDEKKPSASAVDDLKIIPFLNKPALLDGLKQELAAYIAKAADVSVNTETLSCHASDLPNWSSAVRKVALIQPSSAAAECVFSLLSCSFGPQQDLTLQDYIECSLMLQYNKR